MASPAGESEQPNATPCAIVLVLHGLFLAGCGCYGAYQHGWEKKVMHSAYSGIGSMTALVICAAMTASGVRKLYMIGVHVALLLQVLFIVVFAVQSYRSYGVPEKADRFGLFVAMAVGSVAGLIGMRVFKPKKKEKK